MRAAKWDLEDGKKRIEGTMQWRREFKPDLIPPEEVSLVHRLVHEGSLILLFVGPDREPHGENVRSPSFISLLY